MSVIFTGQIPQCPHCKKPTIRTRGYSTSTSMYFPAVYDEDGNNKNPDRNTLTTYYHCENCNQAFSISGNSTDGYNYG